MLDIVIQDGRVVDGTGRPAFEADLGIVAGRIVAVAQHLDPEAKHTIDARGLHVAPGFIDPHTHSDLTLLADRRAESKIRQGVTTEVVGNCGSSPAPIYGAAVDEVKADARNYGVAVTWTSMGEYLAVLNSPGTALNIVALVGHNTVRGSVLGYADRQPTREEQSEMERLVSESMDEGARGISTGLFYPPGLYAEAEEVVGLARASAHCGGIYASHIRSESNQLLQSIDEALDIGRRADIAVEVAHLKLSGYRNWGELDRLVDAIDAAQQSGVRFGCDQYPYRASFTWLAAMLPPWAQAGGTKAVAERLADPGLRTDLKQHYGQDPLDWDNRSGVQTWDDILVTECHPHPEVLGRTIAQIAAADGREPIDVLFDLIIASEGQAAAVWFDQSEKNVQTLMAHPLVVVGSDGYALSLAGSLAQRKVHPRSFGTFPRVLGRYVRERPILSLEVAVQKMTSITAQRFGLEDRGLVREGAWADLVLFDATTVTDCATFTDPYQYPTGIPYVLVNGTVVVDQGQHTGALPGRVL